jgi:hypothetical protein
LQPIVSLVPFLPRWTETLPLKLCRCGA